MTTPTRPIPIVDLRGAYKYHYTDELETAAVNNVDVRIEPGEFVAVMGPSGSGKSTLLNLIGMIDDLSKGEYRFHGQEVTRLGRRARARLRKGNIGFIFQSFNLIDELTAAENIELPLLYLDQPRAARKAKVATALAELEMTHRANHYPRQLSGGQQQRIAIARAIVIEPKLILADEPTGNLDSENSALVMQQLNRLHRRGSTIVMVTHSPEDAAQAERVIELFDGQVLVREREYLAQ